jgi:hypothetical protein
MRIIVMIFDVTKNLSSAGMSSATRKLRGVKHFLTDGIIK